MTAWIVLQSSPSDTIALADALKDAGFDVWTPVETVRVEPPRVESWEKRPARKPNRPDIVTRPLIPSMVFARFVHLSDLLVLSHAPALQYRVYDHDKRRMVTRGHPRFWLFDPDARPIADRELDGLRAIASRRRKPRGKVEPFNPGDKVRLTEGAYEGLSGTVVRTEGKLTVVDFSAGRFDLKIQTWLLKADLDESTHVHVKDAQSERGGEAA